jgi:CubicO group peptidase (beta-lactamase class C family)
MKKRILLWLILLFGIQTEAQIPNLNAKLTQLLDQARTLKLFSGTVVVAYHGNPIFQVHEGFADWDSKTAFNDSTRFNVGSIGKDFTKVLVLQLIQEKRLAADDRLSKFFSNFPKQVADAVTVRHLLTMTSGMGDYLNDPNFDPELHSTIQKRIAEVIAKAPLLFAPGTDREYSNSGYVVLGGIIEKVTGQSYFENVRTRILEPLGMRHSFFKFPHDQARNCATGSIARLSGEIEPESRISAAFSPASDGGMFSTALDLLKFDQSLLHDNRLLTDEMKVRYFAGFGEATNALEWGKMKADPKFVVAGAGGLPGWNACISQFPAAGYTAIVLSNVADMDQPAEGLCLRIEAILSGREPMPLQAPLLPFLFLHSEKKGVQYLVEHLDEILQSGGYELPNGQPLNQLGYYFLQQNRGADAIRVFHKNVELFPLRPNLWDSLAEGYLETGQPQKAKEYYQKALEIDPEFEHAREMLKRIGE